MNRRDFLRGVFGVAAAAAIPAPIAKAIEALEPIVALPGEATAYTLSFFVKGLKYFDKALSDDDLITLSAGGEISTKPTVVQAFENGWQRVHVPIRASSEDEATRRANEALSMIFGQAPLYWAAPSLEAGAPSKPYQPAARDVLVEPQRLNLLKNTG